jgi:hypothetical protein
MRSWSTRDFGVTSDDGQGGRLWRVFAKNKDAWLPIGGKMSEADAEKEIQRLREEGRLGHPHKVPA